jgi:hypothetical protein
MVFRAMGCLQIYMDLALKDPALAAKAACEGHFLDFVKGFFGNRHGEREGVKGCSASFTNIRRKREQYSHESNIFYQVSQIYPKATENMLNSFNERVASDVRTSFTNIQVIGSNLSKLQLGRIT